MTHGVLRRFRPYFGVFLRAFSRERTLLRIAKHDTTATRIKAKRMASVADIFLSGFSKPLGQWSERALDQVRDDVCQLLDVETNARARTDLWETLTVIDAEKTRRERDLSPDEVAVLQDKGALRSFNADRAPVIGKKRMLDRAREARDAMVLAFSRDECPSERNSAERDDVERSGGGLER